MQDRQIKRSLGPRQRSTEHAAPKLSRRIGSFRNGSLSSLYWGLALAGVFVVGIGLGATGAILFGAGDPKPSSGSAQIAYSDDQAEDQGYTLSVRVQSSDRARAQYEETLLRTPADASPESDPAPLETIASAAVLGTLVEEEEVAEEGGPAIIVPDQPVSQPAPTEPPVAATGVESLQALEPPTSLDSPWIVNAEPVAIDPTRPMIAVVIDDVGLDQPRSRRAISLPGPLTLALLPYGYNLTDLAASARRNGHELLVHMPMEPLDPEANPGPNALLTGLDANELRRRISWDLDQFSGYVGINNHMGSRFTADPAGMRIVLEEAQARGLLFLDSVTSQKTQGYRLAAQLGLPYAVRDIFLDHNVSLPSIKRQLEKVERAARRQGHAIAIGHPHDATVTALRAWLPTLRDKGFQIVPITAVVRRRLASG